MWMSTRPPDISGISDWRPLARGGFATVWEARQDTLDRPIAVKVDERTLDSDAERRRFLGEARTAGNLSGHPGIVTVHDAGILTDGRPYLVMKLCPGGSLTRWLREDNRQNAERIRLVGIQIADALAAAHAQGMLHRDIKPANILIDRYDQAGLADFGLAVPAEPGTAEGITLAYAPPEAIRREPPTEFGDVYQLAATLYALLGGHPPRKSVGGRVSLEEVISRLDEPVEPLPDVNEDLMAVVLAGLAPDPGHRPTAAQFRDRLAAVDLDGGSHPVGLGADGAAQPRSLRRLALAFAASAVVCLLVIVLGGSGVYLYEIDRSVTANISRGLTLPVDGSGGVKRPVEDPQGDLALDYLLIGTDDNPNTDQQGPSDSIMLVHLDGQRDQAYVVSIPRDTWVDVPGRGRSTINTVYQDGGASLVVQTVEELTDTRIDHVASINFQGFVNLTQDLGGVLVDNPRPFSRFQAGSVSLRGDDALTYVREKPEQNELYRAENQRSVLKAILSKGLSAEVVADPLKFTRFIGNAAKQIRVDNNFSDSELRSTALSLRLKPSAIRLLSIPVAAKPKWKQPAGEKRKQVHVVNQPQLDELSQALRKDTMADYVRTYKN